MQRRVWDKHEIKAEVQRRGETLTGVAIAADLEPSACRVALCRRNLRGEQALARYLGVSLSELWPDRYGKTSKQQSSARQRGPASPNASVLSDIGEAA